MQPEEMIGKSLYQFFDTIKLVEHKILRVSDKRVADRCFHVASSVGKRKVIRLADLDKYSHSPEEAKMAWYKQKSIGILAGIERLEADLQSAKDLIDYDALKQEHPDLLV